MPRRSEKKIQGARAQLTCADLTFVSRVLLFLGVMSSVSQSHVLATRSSKSKK